MSGLTASIPRSCRALSGRSAELLLAGSSGAQNAARGTMHPLPNDGCCRRALFKRLVDRMESVAPAARLYPFAAMVESLAAELGR
jgi:hypothetical protein